MEKPCLFCQIVRGLTSTEILHSTEILVVFRDIHPQAPVHLLIVPRKHIRSVNDLTPEDQAVFGEMLLAAKAMAAQFDISTSGYRLFVNVERGGGQVIFHLHMHLIGGWGR
ncbi:MAG: HIT domain-containing protein [Deltaproteobacteria bacterium]|nr:HIT domain-containing protein [Deltaproteobacteria bacterium]